MILIQWSFEEVLLLKVVGKNIIRHRVVLNIRTQLLSSYYYFLISFNNSVSISYNLRYNFNFNLKFFLKIPVLTISFLVFKYLKLATFIEVDIYFTWRFGSIKWWEIIKAAASNVLIIRSCKNWFLEDLCL